MRIKRTRKQSAPRNSVAKALGNPLFRQRVVKNPNAYRRRPKHRAIPVAEPQDE